MKYRMSRVVSVLSGRLEMPRKILLSLSCGHFEGRYQCKGKKIPKVVKCKECNAEAEIR